MIRPQYSLRALIGVLTLAALAIGVGVPSYRRYQHHLAVTKIRLEVEHGLDAARLQMSKSPEYAELDLEVLRECVRRTPILNDEERRKLEGFVDLALGECRRIEIEQSCAR